MTGLYREEPVNDWVGTYNDRPDYPTDLKGILTPQQSAAGFYCHEDDDHTIQLRRNGCYAPVAVFTTSASIAAIRGEADRLLGKRVNPEVERVRALYGIGCGVD
jgi:hypothetical protein